MPATAGYGWKGREREGGREGQEGKGGRNRREREGGREGGRERDAFVLVYT